MNKTEKLGALPLYAAFPLQTNSFHGSIHSVSGGAEALHRIYLIHFLEIFTINTGVSPIEHRLRKMNSMPYIEAETVFIGIIIGEHML